MKARVKATGEIVEVYSCGERYLECSNMNKSWWEEDLDFNVEEKFAENCLNGIKQDIDYNPDYWTKLEHQYAGMAMQAYIIASHIGQFSFCEGDMKDCKSMAHALVEKLRKKER